MSMFSDVIQNPSPSAPKGIIYGPPGIGKTSIGASADASIIIDCENGAGAIPCCRTLTLCVQRINNNRFIPACAGNTHTNWLTLPAITGSSPRVRGTLAQMVKKRL